MNKHVMDNSCGEGAFLLEVVKRYVQIAKKKGLSSTTIKAHLERYIHGIEIDSKTHQTCLAHLNGFLGHARGKPRLFNSRDESEHFLFFHQNITHDEREKTI